MTRIIHLGYFPWKIHFPSSHYSTIKHGFYYSTKCLPVRAFTIRGPLWSSSIFTSYQPWKNNNESYLHQTILGPLPKPLFYRDFFKGWLHQWQPTLIKNLPLEESPVAQRTSMTTNLNQEYPPLGLMATLWCNNEIISLMLPLEPCLCPLYLINLSLFFINGKGIFPSGVAPPDWTVLLWCFLV